MRRIFGNKFGEGGAQADEQDVETNLRRKGNKPRKTSRNGQHGQTLDRGQDGEQTKQPQTQSQERAENLTRTQLGAQQIGKERLERPVSLFHENVSIKYGLKSNIPGLNI